MCFKNALARLLLPVCLFLAGSGNGIAADIKERTIKYAVLYNLEHPHGLGAQRFRDLVTEKTEGKFKVRIYPGATLGGEVAVTSSFQGGTIEMSAIGTPALVGVIGEYAILDFPFLFNDEKEVDAVLDGPIGKRLLERLPDKGLIGLAWFEHGFRQLTNSKRPVGKLEDLQGLKIRVQQNAVSIDLFNALGANAVPLPFPELYTALETKTVEGQENPFNSIELANFNEVQKYLSETKHNYTPMILLMSKKFWDRLSPDEQKIVQESALEARLYERRMNREQNEKSLQTLKAKGMDVAVLSPEEIARMKEKTRPVIDKYSKQVGDALVKELYAEIDKVRGQK
jgi:tripartite ATP-independent transporter DctP family solute receptor